MRASLIPTGLVRLTAAAAFAVFAGSVSAQETGEDDEEIREITLGEFEDLDSPVLDEEDFEGVARPAPAPPAETPAEQLERYFLLYRDAMDNEAYAEADTLAKRVIELVIEIHGVNSLDTARALTNLGIAQHKNEDYDAAVLNYQAAIDTIERVADRLDSNLINPLKGLGAAQFASGRPDLAADSFQRAVHVSHVNEGPHNLMQVEILESLAETYLSVGELDEVKDIQASIFNLEARDVGLDSIEILPALEKQARWQHRLQQYDKERYTWRKIIDIIEDFYGNDDLRLIPPLTGLGRSHLYVGVIDMSYHQPVSVGSGEVYLKRALRIAEENPESTWQIEESALLSLGDYYIVSGKPNRARKIYEKAWNLLSEEEERLENRREHLEQLTVLQGISPPRYVGIDGAVHEELSGESFKTGTMVFNYDVSTRGFTTNVELVDADPAGFEEMERVVSRDIRAMIHRPRLEDGTTVPTEGLTYTHEFFYRESDLPEQDGDLASTR